MVKAAELLAVFLCLLAGTFGHITITYPCPRYNPNGKDCPSLPDGEELDYSLRSPISTAGQGDSLPFCHHETPWPEPAAELKAGGTLEVTFEPDGATHGGGHCQFSLSYDGGKTYVVIHEELKHCFFDGPATGNTAQVTSYTIDLPEDLPSSDKAIFAWTWVNAVGNREFYMNCADVSVSGSSTSYKGKEMTIANYGDYPTIPEFNGDYDTGLENYENAKSITVTSDGTSSDGGSNEDPESQNTEDEDSGSSKPDGTVPGGQDSSSQGDDDQGQDDQDPSSQNDGQWQGDQGQGDDGQWHGDQDQGDDGQWQDDQGQGDDGQVNDGQVNDGQADGGEETTTTTGDDGMDEGKEGNEDDTVDTGNGEGAPIDDGNEDTETETEMESDESSEDESLLFTTDMFGNPIISTDSLSDDSSTEESSSEESSSEESSSEESSSEESSSEESSSEESSFEESSSEESSSEESSSEESSSEESSLEEESSSEESSSEESSSEESSSEESSEEESSEESSSEDSLDESSSESVYAMACLPEEEPELVCQATTMGDLDGNYYEDVQASYGTLTVVASDLVEGDVSAEPTGTDELDSLSETPTGGSSEDESTSEESFDDESSLDEPSDSG